MLDKCQWCTIPYHTIVVLIQQLFVVHMRQWQQAYTNNNNKKEKRIYVAYDHNTLCNDIDHNPFSPDKNRWTGICKREKKLKLKYRHMCTCILIHTPTHTYSHSYSYIHTKKLYFFKCYSLANVTYEIVWNGIDSCESDQVSIFFFFR